MKSVYAKLLKEGEWIECRLEIIEHGGTLIVQNVYYGEDCLNFCLLFQAQDFIDKKREASLLPLT